MKSKDLRDLILFDEDGPRRETLYESDRIFSQVICLDPSQRHGPVADPGSDALCVIIAGRVAAQVDKSRARMDQWETILVPAGARLTLANASEDPAVVLVVAAPPPA